MEELPILESRIRVCARRRRIASAPTQRGMSGRRRLGNSVALLPLVSCLLMQGCAWTTKYLAAEPTTRFTNESNLALPDKLKDHVKLICIQGGMHPVTSDPCLYTSVQINNIYTLDLTNDVSTFDLLVSTLLSVSDTNCDTFLQRAFANRAGLDVTKTGVQDVATAISAGTASVSAPASAIIGGVNLVVGKSTDSVTSTYYAEKTFQAMEQAIKAARSDMRRQIEVLADNNRKTGNERTEYMLPAAVADVQAYDTACSIRGGLAQLAKLAADQNTAQSEKLKTVREAPTGSKSSANQAQ